MMNQVLDNKYTSAQKEKIKGMDQKTETHITGFNNYYKKEAEKIEEIQR